MEYNKETKTLIIHHDYNEELKNIPEETKIIIFDENSKNNEYSKFNQTVDNLPQSITHLTFGFYFNQIVNELPQSITHLTFGFCFNQTVNKLPQNLIHLTFGLYFNQIVDKIPTTIKELSLCCNNNLINNLPEHIEKLFINFTHKITKVENLPFTLKEIIIKNKIYKKLIKIPFGCILTIQKN